MAFGSSGTFRRFFVRASLLAAVIVVGVISPLAVAIADANRPPPDAPAGGVKKEKEPPTPKPAATKAPTAKPAATKTPTPNDKKRPSSGNANSSHSSSSNSNSHHSSRTIYVVVTNTPTRTPSATATPTATPLPTATPTPTPDITLPNGLTAGTYMQSQTRSPEAIQAAIAA